MRIIAHMCQIYCHMYVRNFNNRIYVFFKRKALIERREDMRIMKFMLDTAIYDIAAY